MDKIMVFINVFCRSITFLVLFAAVNIACTSSKHAGTQQGVYRAPGYVRKNYKEILVYARIQNPVYRQKLENAMVNELNNQGYHAVPAYKNFDVTYKYDSVEFMSKITELKIDGLVAFDYLGHQTAVQDSYRYNGGMYNYLYTGTAPFDLETSTTQAGYVRLDFYNLDARVSQYNTVVSMILSGGLDEAIKQLTQETYRRLKSDRII